MPGEILKAIVVDDSNVSRRFLERILRDIASVEVVGSASNGEEGVRAVAELEPDVVFLDIEMPVMDGLAALQIIRRDHPKSAVLMFSGVTDASRTMQALQFGAIDFIPKPEASQDAEVILRSQLGRALRIVAAQAREQGRTQIDSPQPVRSIERKRIVPSGGDDAASRIVVIGVSTGGPRALEYLIPTLEVLDCPVLIVQHMPKGFTESLAASLDAKTSMRVTEAKDADSVVAGQILIAPGGQQMSLRTSDSAADGYVIEIRDDPPVNECRPSVDVLFESVAACYNGRILAAIMTGMGSDGCKGVRALRKKGVRAIAQDEASCVVYGMPRALIEAGLADEVVPLGELGDHIRQFATDVPAELA